jgi:hypothetical protein
MRVEAGIGMGRLTWCVWHAEWCKVLCHVLWVDDETMRWSQVDMPLSIVGGGFATTVHQAKKIIIDVDRLMVTINPIEDVEAIDLAVSEEVTCGAH